jgi:hypothetical protein
MLYCLLAAGASYNKEIIEGQTGSYINLGRAINGLNNNSNLKFTISADYVAAIVTDQVDTETSEADSKFLYWVMYRRASLDMQAE